MNSFSDVENVSAAPKPRALHDSRNAAGMDDDLLRVKLKKLLLEAEDCKLIGKLATDLQKRELFKKLAADLRAMARNIETEIAGRAPKGE
jgi:hypothetical protein